jgi:hypothetical protein
VLDEVLKEAGRDIKQQTLPAKPELGTLDVRQFKLPNLRLPKSTKQGKRVELLIGRMIWKS